VPVSGGETFLNLLRECGIEYIFCSPGTEWTPVWEGLARRHIQGDNSLKYVNCRHETLAISMAMGYAKSTGNLPAVLLHASVGALSGAVAIRNAFIGRVPMVIFSGETAEHTGDAQVRAQGWHWLGLLSDIGGPSKLVSDYVKWSNRVPSEPVLYDSVYRGCQIARTSPRGPIFLSIATELMIRSLEHTEYVRTYPVVSSTVPAENDLKEAAKQLILSKNPVIITEHTGKTAGIVNILSELAGLLDIPVFESSLPYYANFPKDNPLYMGYNVLEALPEADTVFVIGSVTPWYPPSAISRSQASVIQMNEAPCHENLPYSGYRSNISITADIEQGLTALLNVIRAETQGLEISPPFRDERRDLLRSRHDEMLARWRKEAEQEMDNTPISPRWFLYAARKILPPDSIILDETLTHTRFVHQYTAVPGYYYKSAYGGLGVGMGEAAGMKLANPGRPVVLFIGDGAFNYNPVLAGLGMCQEYRLPFVIIILDNGGYGAMKFGYQRLFPEGWAASQNKYFGVDITPAPDYIKIAEAFGAIGQKLTHPSEIEPALSRALERQEEGKTSLLDIMLY
jgi:acetolactate synthase-1/2/3 large subunit